MRTYEDPNSNMMPVDFETPKESEISDRFNEPCHGLQRKQDTLYPNGSTCRQAVWRLRLAKREVFMFRLRRYGEVAMSAAALSLGGCALVQSLSGGRIEDAATCAMGILWGLGVGCGAVRDFNSQDYTQLINNRTQEILHYDDTRLLA